MYQSSNRKQYKRTILIKRRIMSKLNDFLLQFGTDKFLHFVGGACVMAITNSWIVLAIVSIGKEIYDYKSY